MNSETQKRLDALRAYKENEATIDQMVEAQKQDRRSDLITQIQALKPRIDDLIATGNACLESKIPLTGQAFGLREDYTTHQFFTNSWSHLVGFVGNPHMRPCTIEYMGINAGGACGSYDFRTDGSRVFSVHESKPYDIVEPSIGHMERFLRRFDAFESSFYAYVDEEIQKQQTSVDKLISKARERAAGRSDLHQGPNMESGLWK